MSAAATVLAVQPHDTERTDLPMQPQNTISPEEWRPVVGWEGWYEVSDLGRVRRVRRAPATRPGLILVPSSNPNGKGGSPYPIVHLWKCCRGKAYAIHRLVLAAFVGPRPAGRVAHHKNADRSDNRLANLEYVTQSHNVRDGFERGRPPTRISKLKPGEAALIRASDESAAVLAERYGVTRQIINRARGVACLCCPDGRHVKTGRPRAS